jgi:hypothetical protein
LARMTAACLITRTHAHTQTRTRTDARARGIGRDARVAWCDVTLSHAALRGPHVCVVYGHPGQHRRQGPHVIAVDLGWRVTGVGRGVQGHTRSQIQLHQSVMNKRTIRVQRTNGFQHGLAWEEVGFSVHLQPTQQQRALVERAGLLQARSNAVKHGRAGSPGRRRRPGGGT